MNYKFSPNKSPLPPFQRGVPIRFLDDLYLANSFKKSIEICLTNIIFCIKLFRSRLVLYQNELPKMVTLFFVFCEGLENLLYFQYLEKINP